MDDSIFFHSPLFSEAAVSAWDRRCWKNILTSLPRDKKIFLTIEEILESGERLVITSVKWSIMEGSVEHRSKLRLNISNKHCGAYRRKSNRKSRRGRAGEKRLYIKVRLYYYRTNNSRSVFIRFNEKKTAQKLIRAARRNGTFYFFAGAFQFSSMWTFSISIKKLPRFNFPSPVILDGLAAARVFGIKKI